jgi:hypothetical protein
MITEKDINNALNRLIKHVESLKDIKDLLELYNELKDLELRVKVVRDMVAEILMGKVK